MAEAEDSGGKQGELDPGKSHQTNADSSTSKPEALVTPITLLPASVTDDGLDHAVNCIGNPFVRNIQVIRQNGEGHVLSPYGGRIARERLDAPEGPRLGVNVSPRIEGT